MADENKPLGVFAIIIIIFLSILVFGVMAGTFFPDSFLNDPI